MDQKIYAPGAVADHGTERPLVSGITVRPSPLKEVVCRIDTPIFGYSVSYMVSSSPSK